MVSLPSLLSFDEKPSTKSPPHPYAFIDMAELRDPDLDELVRELNRRIDGRSLSTADADRAPVGVADRHRRANPARG